MTTTLSLRFLGAIKTLAMILWLSVSSKKFYYEVYKYYRGYGLRYLFTLSFISSVIYCLFLFHELLTIKGYLHTAPHSPVTAQLEYIIKDLPDIHYNGKSIFIEGENPIFLYDKIGRMVAVIDHKDKLSYAQKEEATIVFTSTKILISIVESPGRKHSKIPINYSTIFGTQSKLLTQDEIKGTLALLFNSMPTIFIYMGMPLLVLLRFISVLLEKSLLILLIYFLTGFFGPTTTIKDCIRLISFACGTNALIQPVIILIVPQLSGILWLIQSWAIFLLLGGVLQARKEQEQRG